MHVTVDGLRRSADEEGWDCKGVKEWLDRAATHSGLLVIAGPTVKQFEGVIHGWSMIAESHISCHLDVLRGRAFLEMFSCRDFDSAGFVKLCAESFGLMSIQVSALPRGSLP